MKCIRSLFAAFFALALLAPGSHAANRKASSEVLTEKDVDGAKRASIEATRERNQLGALQPMKGKPEMRIGPPVDRRLKKAPGRVFDLRALPATRPPMKERPERVGPLPAPVMAGAASVSPQRPSVLTTPIRTAVAPAPIISFEGLDHESWGAGNPRTATGDAGPTHYIQAADTSIAIYRKSDGLREAAFTFDTLMSHGNFGNQCDNQNFGDPAVLYDTFEDRWILTDLAFSVDGRGVNPPNAHQCFAVSMTGDPITGGWNFYSTEVSDGLYDNQQLGVWSDGIYMSANRFGYANGARFQGTRAWAINKAQLYAGEPIVRMVSFDLTAGDFSLMPGNARLQTGTPPPGRPNLFVSTWNYLDAVSVYRFHVDWKSTGLSTFTGPDVSVATASAPGASGAPLQTGSSATFASGQNQYTNRAGSESLWVTHTVPGTSLSGFAAPRWYQVSVNDGIVAPALSQAATWDADRGDTNRFMPSLAVDRAGNMALAYSASSSSTHPSIRYAGRLATDPANTFSQTEQTLLDGTSSQTGRALSSDYSAATLDPDGCTVWITNQYANPSSHGSEEQWLTRIGAFRFRECTPVGTGGTLSGTVLTAAGGSPVAGAIVELGARSTKTDASGNYSFLNLPAGTYPSAKVSNAGFFSSLDTSIVIKDNGKTRHDFSLITAALDACPTDTLQADFQAGVATNIDIVTAPDSVILARPSTIDQENTTLGIQGAPFNTTTWLAQTFTSGITGPVLSVELNLFSLDCGAVTMPDITVSIRTAAGGVPTGADLAVATIPGFCNGTGAWYTATFAAPPSLTSGTEYAIVWRAAAPIPGGVPAPQYFATVSSAIGPIGDQNPYAGGNRAFSATSGATWTGETGDPNNDHGFAVHVDLGYVAAGSLVSSVKDSNPTAGLTPIWTTITWNGTAPTNTTLQIQVAGSNSPSGPFVFVGPDGTAATFFTSGDSLAQFYNLRYLQYRATLETTDGTVTPTLTDVQLCYSTTDCSTTVATITPGSAQVCENSTGNGASGPAGMTSYAWSISNGTIQGSTTSETISFTAGPSGTVDLTLSVVAANGCRATSTANIPIVVIATPTITPGGPTTFCPGGSVTLTSSSATGNQWYLNGNPIGGETNQNYIATGAGDYTVIVSTSGCSSFASTATTVTVDPATPTPTVTPDGPTTFCDGGSVTLTSDSATGNQWYLNGNPIGGATSQSYNVTASGSYTVIISGSGCPSAPSSPTVVTVNPIPATPTITPGGSTALCTGGSVTLNSSSASGNQWYFNGNPLGGETNQSYVATLAGDYTVIVSLSGCDSASSTATTVTVTPIPATPTVTPDGPTTFCDGGSVTLTSSSATGNQWFLNGNPIGGETNQTYVVTASGSYTVTETATGCSSAASTPIVVTVNPIPATPTITPGGPTAFCTGGSVTLTSSSATGNQWYLDGNPIGGETNQNYVATMPGNYTVIVSQSGCDSAASSATTVTVNPIPATPTATPDGPTTFCDGGSVTLTSSSSTGNQWFLDGNPIGGATNQTYVVTTSGSYTVTETAAACSSPASNAVVVTVNPVPATPTITPSGPTAFCTGGSVTLTSSSVTGNQWYLDGNPIGGETNQNYVATMSGNYTVIVSQSGCDSAASAATTVTVNPIPATPTATPDGPTTFCDGGSVTLTSSSLTGNQWFLDGNPIGGATNQTYVVTASGSYTVTETAAACSSPASNAVVVTVNPVPATPTITPDGPTTFCAGGSVTLTSSSATGNQWYLGGNPIGGETNQTYIATTSGDYTVIVSQSGCDSAASATTTVTVNPIPATPTITPDGPTTFCSGGSVTLTSSSATGNQWFLGGNPIGGATNQSYVASFSGDYTVVVTTSGCSSPSSTVTTVTMNPTPDATMTAPAVIVTGSTGNIASVADAGPGVTYTWTIVNGSIDSGAGTNSISFTAGAIGTMTLDVTVSTATCSDSSSASITVTSSVILTSVTPGNGSSLGGTSVTITGSGFESGASVTFGGTAATNVVVVNDTQITATTPAHAAGPVDVVVTNTDTASGTLTNGFTYDQQNFDPNGDSVIDPSDIFYLVAYLFTGGPAPAGVAGPVASGDANGDGVVDPADIFYAVNYLFGGGPAPFAGGRVSSSSLLGSLSGSVTLGEAVRRDERWFVPVIVTTGAGSTTPQSLSMRVVFSGTTDSVAMHRAAGMSPAFEVTRHTQNAISYLVSFNDAAPMMANRARSAVVAEIEVSAPGAVRLEVDRALTMLVDRNGTTKATASNGQLRVNGTLLGRNDLTPRERMNQQ